MSVSRSSSKPGSRGSTSSPGSLPLLRRRRAVLPTKKTPAVNAQPPMVKATTATAAAEPGRGVGSHPITRRPSPFFSGRSAHFRYCSLLQHRKERHQSLTGSRSARKGSASLPHLCPGFFSTCCCLCPPPCEPGSLPVEPVSFSFLLYPPPSGGRQIPTCDHNGNPTKEMINPVLSAYMSSL